MKGNEFFNQILFALTSYVSSNHPDKYRIEFAVDKEFHIDIFNENYNQDEDTVILITVPREDLDISSV